MVLSIDTFKRIVIDYEKCVGCRICEIVCSMENEKTINPKLSRIKVVSNYPFTDIPIVCAQCLKAPCISVCPTEALRRNAEGIVSVNDDECVGCGLCVNACPLGAIFLHPEKNVAVKCNLCNGDPLCVKKCPSNALKFISLQALIGQKTEAITKNIDLKIREKMEN